MPNIIVSHYAKGITMNDEIKNKLQSAKISGEEDLYKLFNENYIFFTPYKNYFWLRYNEFKLLMSLFPNAIDKSMDVLEIGCGFGFNSLLMATRAKSVLGVDIPEKYPSLVMGNEQTSVDVARAVNNELKIKNVRFEHSWPTKIECCEDNAVNLIFSEYVFEHIPDLNAAIKEMHRCLKSGGGMLHVVPVTQDAVITFLKSQVEKSKERNSIRKLLSNIRNPVKIPGCHSEFLSDFSEQLDLYCLENYVFKLQENGFCIKDIKQTREHNRIIYAVKM